MSAVCLDLLVISIHAPREGGDSPSPETVPVIQPISIHAPREGGDRGNVKIIVTGPRISIHAPREGGDVIVPREPPLILYFNPRPPRGGRRFG